MKKWLSDLFARARRHTDSPIQEKLRGCLERTVGLASVEARGRQDMERLMVLAGVSNEDPLWKLVLSYADEHERNEVDAALRAGLSDGERQFAAGRLASAVDFASALRGLRVEAERKARREGRDGEMG